MSSTDETRARLRERADRGYPAAWIPEHPGDELVAVVTGMKTAVRTSYGPAPVLELEELGTRTPWSLWLVHTVLRREVWRARPAAGETLYVRYDGPVTPDGGGPAYEGYTVIVDRPDENNEVDWQGLAARYDHDALEPDPAATKSEDDTPGEGAGDADDIPF